MAHYDLYQSLGLSRRATPQELAAEIEQRLATTPADDVGQLDQLNTARAILGDETRRSLYDQRLDDPSAPEIDVASLRELAALNEPGAGSPDGTKAAGSTGRVGQLTGQVRDSFRQSRVLAIMITAVVTAVIAGLVGWGTGLFGGGDAQSRAASVVEDMLKIDDEDELRDWVKENSIPKSREDVLSGLDLGDGQSFNGFDALFGSDDLKVDTTFVSVEFFKMIALDDVEEMYEGAKKNAGLSREEVDSMLIFSITDGTDIVGGASLVERDGDYKLIEVDAD
ncbi:hypothetical protein PQI66_14700 [Corynebacterium sp. USCH3]|uniref:hypothetical protein n=1 Tax=Corynebacterium sp. USCH3 TaxID=3024840 RepID=UPI0030A336AD